MKLCSAALINSNLAKDENDARVKLQKVLDNGKALEIFAKMTSSLGGPSDFCENPDKYLKKANIIKAIYSSKEGIVSQIDTIALGMSVVTLGGGRLKPSDIIDHSVGLENVIALGAFVDKHKPLAIIHAKDLDSFKEAKKRVLEAIIISDITPSVKEVYEIFN